MADSERPFATVPLADLLPGDGEIVTKRVVGPLYEPERRTLGLFAEFISQFQKNLHSASGAVYPQAARTIIYPQNAKGTMREIVNAYLTETPLLRLFDAEVPFNFVDKLGEHGLLLAASGWGKSQFIQSLISTSSNSPIRLRSSSSTRGRCSPT